MLETFITLTLLLVGLFAGNEQLLIAAGLFCIAANISLYTDMRRKE